MKGSGENLGALFKSYLLNFSSCLMPSTKSVNSVSVIGFVLDLSLGLNCNTHTEVAEVAEVESLLYFDG